MLLLCSSVFAFGQTRNDTDLSLSDHAREVAERNAQMGFNDTIDRLADDFIEASLIVSDPGNQNLFSVFGHSAIRLQCSTFGLDYCFSYESENLSKDIYRFASGEMLMGMMAFRLEDYIRLDIRAISEYPMNLPPVAKIKLWEILDGHLREEYCMQYDYLHRACAYMNLVMLDEMDDALDDIEIIYNAYPDNIENMTYGDMLCEESKEASWTRFWISTICYGKETIDPSIPIKQKIMYPNQLVYTLQNATIDGVPLLSKEKIIHTTANPIKDTWCKPLYLELLLLLFVIIGLFSQKQYIDWVVLTIQTLFAFFVTYLIVFSKLPCTDWSFISILYNPMPIIFWHWRKYWSLPYAIILMVWAIVMALWPHYIVDSSHLVFTCSFALILFKQWVIGHQFPKGELQHDWHNPLLANCALWFAGGVELLKLNRACAYPQNGIVNTLRKILSASQNTTYGKEHCFSEILSARADRELIEKFYQLVPVNSYEDLRSYVEMSKKGDESILFEGKPLMYAITSGTTSEPKWIPISESYIKNIAGRMSRLWFFSFVRLCPWVFTGVNLSIVGKSVEDYSEDGTICGSVSRITQQKAPRFLRYLHALPAGVNDIADYSAKYYTIMRLALEKNVTSIITPNPSTILELQNVVDKHFDILIEDLKKGTLSSMFYVEDNIRQSIEKSLKPNPRRAEELLVCRQSFGRVLPKHYWPNMQILNTWKCGNTAIYAKKLQGFFPEAMKHLEFGYFATECRFGLVLDESNNTVLFPHMHYYEFIKQEDVDKQNPTTCQIYELQEGGIYCPVVTTCSGLYRYNMNDLIVVGPKYKGTPTIHMLQKTNGYVNMTGEKMHETQFIMAVHKAETKTNIKTYFYIAFADVNESRYHFMFEFAGKANETILKRLVEEVDTQLCQINIEYKSKRNSHRILEPQGYILPPNAFVEYKKAFIIPSGCNDGQFKINLLMQNDKVFSGFLQIANKTKRY